MNLNLSESIWIYLLQDSDSKLQQQVGISFGFFWRTGILMRFSAERAASRGDVQGLEWNAHRLRNPAVLAGHLRPLLHQQKYAKIWFWIPKNQVFGTNTLVFHCKWSPMVPLASPIWTSPTFECACVALILETHRLVLTLAHGTRRRFFFFGESHLIQQLIWIDIHSKFGSFLTKKKAFTFVGCGLFWK